METELATKKLQKQKSEISDSQNGCTTNTTSKATLTGSCHLQKETRSSPCGRHKPTKMSKKTGLRP
jgi:hypothetical protein